MKNKINLIIIVITIFMLSIIYVNAIVISDGNNPGTGSATSGGASGGTVWEPPYAKSIRFRVFRSDGTKVELGGSEYFSIANSSSGCFKSLQANVCETNGYNYSSLVYSSYEAAQNNASTCSYKTVNLGCLVADGLEDTFKIENGNWSYTGEILSNFLNANSYANLIEILENYGYGTTGKEIMEGDYVIIEPATKVTCGGNYYYGTSTALMLKNVSYSGVRGYNQNICSNDSNSGYTFMNLFNYMSSAVKVSAVKEFTASTQDYSGFGYFKYNISDISYNGPNGDLRVEIYVDGTNPKKLITSDSLTYNIRSGHNCTGNIVENNLSTAHSGYKISNLETGNYSIELIKHPSTSSYRQKTGINYTCRNVTLTSSGETVSIPYEKGCNIKKNEKAIDGYTMSEAIELYNEYGYNGLLDTSNPVCATVSCSTQNVGISCLNATLTTNISSNNLVCADIIRNNINGNAVAFCDNSFNLVSNLLFDGNYITTFYGTSGELLIKKIMPDNLYRVYKENNIEEYIDAQNGIATAVSRKTCYVVRGNELPQTYNTTVPEIDSYLNNDKLVKINKTNYSPNYPRQDGIFDVYDYETRYNFDLNDLYLKRLSGEVVLTESNDTVTVTGLISKFKDKEGNIPFNVEYEDKSYSPTLQNGCKYVLTPRIIDFRKDENGKISLEFRTVDTSNPFNRNTMSNWSNGNDNSKDNDTVKTYIKDAVNSYGLDKYGNKTKPKYEIILTPKDIQIIREYNKVHQYDNYLMKEVSYGESKVIRNSFLYGLEIGKLDNKNLNNKLYNLKYPI